VARYSFPDFPIALVSGRGRKVPGPFAVAGPRPSSKERRQLGFWGGTAVCPSIIFVAPPHARLGDAES